MPSNDLQTLDFAAAAALGTQMGTVLAQSPSPYTSVSAGLASAIGEFTTELIAFNDDVEAKKAAYRAAIAARKAGRHSLVGAMAAVARAVYGQNGLRSDQIAALGLQLHSKSRAKIVPQIPLKLTATPGAGGEFRLEWDRNGNPSGVNFLIESQTSASAPWLLVADTTAAKATLTGYAPGVAASFRVTASKNGTMSAPSAPVTIYPTAAAPTLRLAA